MNIISLLESNKNLDYQAFMQKICFTKYPIVGVKIPTVKKLAKDLLKENDFKEILSNISDATFEEVLLEAFIISYAKVSFEEKINLIKNFLPKIDNWAICDSFCNSLKIVVTDKDYWFLYFQKYLANSEEFKVRVGLVVYLNFFIEEKYLDEIFRLVESIKLDKYYVNMASAWLLCECFIKYPEKTLKFLQKSEINTFTFKKTISKIRDSYQVKKEVKDYLLEMKRSSENETV